ncbi:Eukaryotic rRNA processing [Babesia duncani]|uniref:Eukaryotic rRNA processing n=1 Tax=Babesia duncani TaxID=323732 RepID=A0AAD9UQ60_9APIC|nr:Eukaryotic rRNA processing [Babesia duncani]
MPVQIKALGYTLAPGERFADENDCINDDENEQYNKPEINLKQGLINNKHLTSIEILAKIQEISLKPIGDDKTVPWIESLHVIAKESIDDTMDINQAIQVEQHFKNVTLEAVKMGLEKLACMGVPFNRPNDFYADMIKSDLQMNNIMAAIATKRVAIEEKRKKRATKIKGKFTKKVKQFQKRKAFTKQVEQIKKQSKGEALERKINELIKHRVS